MFFFKEATCNRCKKTGHIEAACKIKKSKQSSSSKKQDKETHKINADSDSDEVYIHDITSKTHSVSKGKKYAVEVKINSKKKPLWKSTTARKNR